MNRLWLFAKHEFSKHRARPNAWLCSWLLYLIVASLLPIALNGWSQHNLWLVPAILWSALLLVAVINQDNLIRHDFKLGAFDIILQSDVSLSAIFLIKIIVHWFFYALPCVILTPMLAATFGLNAAQIAIITLSILLGSITLSFMSAIGAALTVALDRGGIFVAILILPLYVPVLVIGSNLGRAYIAAMPVHGHFALLGAASILVVLLVPIAVATAVKVNME